MTNQENQPKSNTKTIKRDQFLALVDAAIAGGIPKFARQAALTWLASFSGDLGINLRLSRALLGDGKNAQAYLILEKLLMTDPEFIEAWELHLPLLEGGDSQKFDLGLAAYYLLTEKKFLSKPIPGWAMDLRKAAELISKGSDLDAENVIQSVLNTQPDCIHAALLHLKALHHRKDILALYRFAEKYHIKWPECLSITLFLAEARIEMGFEPEAVELLHHCVANDATGQVASRMWGDQHPYRPMWPDSLEIQYDELVPIEVAVRLGWNMLPQGEKQPREIPENLSAQPDQLVEKPEVVSEASEKLTEHDSNMAQTSSDQKTAGFAQEPAPVPSVEPKPVIKYGNERRKDLKIKGYDPLKSISDEFEKMAKRLKKPTISRTDGRFPVYVIFSSRLGLETQYGPQTAAVLIEELKSLVAALRNQPGMGSMLYVPDDPEMMKLVGIAPIESNDPWKIKNALMDLDQALAKKGEMIGALLIFGGPEVVPFHMLPNPIDDMDKEVPSDNPYATTDANYFVQEWPVGRIPGEKGPDAGLLLDQIRKITKAYVKKSKNKSINLRAAGSLFDLLIDLFRRLRTQGKPNSLGYTAQVWQNSSKVVYKTIGDPNLLESSPPETSESIDKGKVVQSKLGYFNLHGLVDAAEWYGQRDPAKVNSGPDYPVALSPKDIKKNGHSPQVVFTEACYGSHIQNKSAEDALALKFLSLGTTAYVGSTCIAYGSMEAPLIAADLLGNAFWTHLKEGQTAGNALLQAKLDLIKEMNKRQGYLDAEDQKTLISFVLLGDPMAVFKEIPNGSKTVERLKDQPQLKMICDQELIPGDPQPVSGEILNQIKGVVEAYLPGLKDGELSFALQKISPDLVTIKKGDAAKSQTRLAGQSSQRIVVSVRKAIQGTRHIHYHHARVTLDSRGKMVKLTVSR